MYIPILVKTHESATNAFFGLDFDEDEIMIWTEDSNAMITRTNSYIPNGNLIQAYHNYSYNDLFADGAERTFYVQGLAAGKHDIDVTYVLDGYDLPAVELSVIFLKIVLDEPDGLPIQSVTVVGDSRFRLNPACFEWQYVHIDNEKISYYATQPIKCEIEPETFSNFEWIVSDGTILNSNSETPIYKPNIMPVPASVENVQLQLQVFEGVIIYNATRTLEVYRDHLERDYSNWTQMTECGAPFSPFFWKFERYSKEWRMLNSWNCFGSVWHAYDGSKNGYTTYLPTTGFSVQTYDEPIPWNQVTTNLIRGDFVSFYTYNSSSNTEVLQHAHTSVGSNNLMFGANNEPVYGWFASRDDSGNGGFWEGGSWRWCTTTSEDYYNGVNYDYKIFKQTSTNLLNRIKVHRRIQ